MKLTLRYKGGEGSGHFGHRGRPGKQGGSLPGKSAITDNDVVTELMGNERMRKLAIALAADGSIDDVANLYEMLASYNDIDINYDPEESSTIANELYTGYEKATAETGYLVRGDEITAEREAWEKKYYGKVVGGFHAGEQYALEEIQKFIAERFGLKPREKPKFTSLSDDVLYALSDKIDRLYPEGSIVNGKKVKFTVMNVTGGAEIFYEDNSKEYIDYETLSKI